MNSLSGCSLGAQRRFAAAGLATCCALAAVFAWPPRIAHACSCMSQTPQAAYDQAVAVFEGHVVAIDTVDDDLQLGPHRKVRMQVVRSFKGAEDEELVLRTPRDGAACGYEFEVDQSYLVYAQAQTDGLETNLCTRTQPIEQAGEDLSLLGMGATPVDPEPPPAPAEPEEQPEQAEPDQPARTGCAGCSSSAGAVAGLGVLAGVARPRFRRRSGSRP